MTPNPMQQIREIIDDPVYSVEGKLTRVRSILANPDWVCVPREPTEAMCGVVEYGSASRMCETHLTERMDFLRKAIAAGGKS